MARVPRTWLRAPVRAPFPRDRAGMTNLAVLVRIALAVARAGRRAAAPAGALVARLDGLWLLARWGRRRLKGVSLRARGGR
jgi:hypothetical protein